METSLTFTLSKRTAFTASRIIGCLIWSQFCPSHWAVILLNRLLPVNRERVLGSTTTYLGKTNRFKLQEKYNTNVFSDEMETRHFQCASEVFLQHCHWPIRTCSTVQPCGEVSVTLLTLVNPRACFFTDTLPLDSNLNFPTETLKEGKNQKNSSNNNNTNHNTLRFLNYFFPRLTCASKQFLRTAATFVFLYVLYNKYFFFYCICTINVHWTHTRGN